VRAKPFRLSPSFNSGLYGGLIGGALAGLFIGVAYYVEFSSWDKSVTLAIVPQIFLYGSFSGLLLGAFIQLIILWLCHLVKEKQYPSLAFNEVTGGLLGGAIGGIPVGALAGLIFGFRHEYFVGPVPLMTGSLFGVIFIALGALFFDYGGRWQNVTRAFIASLLITACTATAGIVILQLLNIEAWFFFGMTSTLITQGGAILGVVIGMVLGLQVGLTLSLYRLWEVIEH
jgi:hypothetical protein